MYAMYDDVSRDDVKFAGVIVGIIASIVKITVDISKERRDRIRFRSSRLSKFELNREEKKVLDKINKLEKQVYDLVMEREKTEKMLKEDERKNTKNEDEEHGGDEHENSMTVE